jgi:hypothetical protein
MLVVLMPSVGNLWQRSLSWLGKDWSFLALLSLGGDRPRTSTVAVVASREPSNKLIFKLQSIFEARDVVYSNSRDVF